MPDPVDPAEIVAVAVSKVGQGLGEATAKALTEVHELDHYVRAFTESSDRVRRVMLIAVVASILVFAAQRNALPGTWMKGRLEMARVAVRNRLWDHPRERLDKCLKDPKKNPAAVGVGFLNSCDEVKRLVDLISANHSEESLKADLSELERSYLSDVLWVSVPFLGIRLDVNDLGMLSSIGLVVILFTLTFAMARQNENLFLCLWKVRQLAPRGGDCANPSSRANLLYHALTMAQVFSRPPTLARWQPGWVGRYAPRILLVVPALVQAYVLRRDLKTLAIGRAQILRAANINVSLEVLFFATIVACTVISFFYARSADLRWRDTFIWINLDRHETPQPSWWEWQRIKPRSANGEVVSVEPECASFMLKTRERDDLKFIDGSGTSYRREQRKVTCAQLSAGQRITVRYYGEVIRRARRVTIHAKAGAGVDQNAEQGQNEQRARDGGG